MAEIEYWDWPPSHYEKTDAVKEIEAILGFEFERVYSPEKIFQDEYPPSYHEVMNPVREMIKDAHGGHIFLGENMEVRGINLYAKKYSP